ncbi:MAG TPA: PA14 domain-containing protein [bacterium]|nr:PA14 domain-containing protein [bacterium]HQL61761.1 PA14 domain-containing protein [bacterium]
MTRADISKQVNLYVNRRTAAIFTFVCLCLLGIRMCDESRRGLIRTIIPEFDGQAGEPAIFRDSTVHFVDWTLRRDASTARKFTAQWDGFIWVDHTDRYTLVIFSDGDSHVAIDGDMVLHKPPSWDFIPKEQTVVLTRGSHTISIRYMDQSGHSAVSFCLKEGDQTQPCPSQILSPFPITKREAIFRSWSDRVWPVVSVMILCAVIFWSHLLIRRYANSNRPPLDSNVWTIIRTLFVLGFAFRAYVAAQSEWLLLADESVVGIAGQRISRGDSFPLMYYGQPYGGPFEAYLIAPFFFLFGSSEILLRMMPVVLSALGIPLIGWAAGRAFGDRAGLVAAALWCIPPLMPLVYSMYVMVGPVENLLVVVLAVGFWARLSDRVRSPSRTFVFLTGTAAGAALWVNAQILYVLVPLSLFLLTPMNHYRSRGFFSLFFGGLFVGCFPLLIYNIQYPFATLHCLLLSDGKGTLFSNFRGDFLRGAAPVLLGMNNAWRLMDYLSLWPTTFGPALFAIGVILCAVWKLATHWKRDRNEDPGRHFRLLFLMACFLFGIVVFSMSNFPGKAPRHLFLIYPVYLFLLAWAIAALWRHSATAACVLLGLQLFWNIQGIAQSDPRYYFQPIHRMAQGEFIPADLREAVAQIRRFGVDGVYSDYWIGENLAFALEESIPVSCTPYRRLDQTQAALQGISPGYVLHVNQPDEPVYDLLFREMGWNRAVALPLLLYSPRECLPSAKSEWHIGTENTSVGCAAWDGSLETAWLPSRGQDSLLLSFPNPIFFRQVAVLSENLSNTDGLSVLYRDRQLSASKTKHLRNWSVTILDVPETDVRELKILLPRNKQTVPNIYEIFLF